MGRAAYFHPGEPVATTQSPIPCVSSGGVFATSSVPHLRDAEWSLALCLTNVSPPPSSRIGPTLQTVKLRNLLPTLGVIAAVVTLLLKTRRTPSPDTPLGTWVPSNPGS